MNYQNMQANIGSNLFGDYILLEHIGAGEFAHVYKARHKDVDFPLAIKIMQRNIFDKHFTHEIEIMSELNHKSIVQLFDVVFSSHKTPLTSNLNNQEGDQEASENSNRDTDIVGIVMEFVDSGTLESILPISQPHVIFKYFSQICNALDYLHNEKKIIHCDIKATNIIIDKYDNAKLIDFGMGQKIENRNKVYGGSPFCLAPEQLKKEVIDDKTDVWALGVLLYRIVARKFPFVSSDKRMLFDMILNQPIAFPEELYIDENLQDLISLMLTKDPKLRPSIRDVINHKWYQSMTVSEKSMRHMLFNLKTNNGQRLIVNTSRIFDQKDLIPCDADGDSGSESKDNTTPEFGGSRVVSLLRSAKFKAERMALSQCVVRKKKYTKISKIPAIKSFDSYQRYINPVTINAAGKRLHNRITTPIVNKCF